MTIAEFLQYAREQLAELSPTPELEARWLLVHVLEKEASYCYSHREQKLSSQQLDKAKDLLTQRCQKIPLAYLLGKTGFWDLELMVTQDTLVPRPETEALVSFVVAKCSAQTELTLLDLGTGSGAIALALKSERPAWQVTAADQSKAALDVAQKNAAHNQLAVEFVLSDWFTAFDGQRFDVVISNPPYLAVDDSHLSDDGLIAEPKSALVSGATGLESLQAIILQARQHLNQKGLLVLEHGCEQGKAVRDLLIRAGFNEVETYLDINGLDRFSAGRSEALC